MPASSRDELLTHLCTAAPASEPYADPVESIDAWRARDAAIRARFADPIEHAIAAGFDADRLGWAFASGYRAAGRSLFGGPDDDRLAALCATEDGGAHPRAIRTTLTDLVLDGTKSFVTLGTAAEVLFVVATQGDDPASGRPRLRIARIDAAREGVRIEPMPPAPFVPEVPHARATFERVRVEPEELLPGDGYDRYLKPFRTVEDIYVHAALVGWLVRVGRLSSWGDDVLEELLALAVTMRALARMSPTAPETHVVLAGALAASRRSVERLDWSRVEGDTRARWERDRVLLGVAGKARAARREAAWKRLRGPLP